MMVVDAQRIVSFRYIMKNASGEVLADTTGQTPVKFVYGSGEISPGIEGPLKGLKIGEKKHFSLSPETVPGLTGVFFFDVIIDDICYANKDESNNTDPTAGCGPDCRC